MLMPRTHLYDCTCVGACRDAELFANTQTSHKRHARAVRGRQQAAAATAEGKAATNRTRLYERVDAGISVTSRPEKQQSKRGSLLSCAALRRAVPSALVHTVVLQKYVMLGLSVGTDVVKTGSD